MAHPTIDPNPYDPPQAPSIPESVEANRTGLRSWRVFVGRALLIGTGIGFSIGLLRLLVEGFYLWDIARDSFVGGSVGAVVGIGWFLFRRFVYGSQIRQEDDNKV